MPAAWAASSASAIPRASAIVVAVSSADLRTSDDPDLLYCPMEWSREPASADFIEVGVELRRLQQNLLEMGGWNLGGLWSL